MAYDSRAHISSIRSFSLMWDWGVEPIPLMWDWGRADTFDVELGWGPNF